MPAKRRAHVYSCVGDRRLQHLSGISRRGGGDRRNSPLYGCDRADWLSRPVVRPGRVGHDAVGNARGTEGSRTLRWRRQSGANSSLGGQNSLLAGKIQGISSTLASVARICRQNGDYNQSFTSKFPTRRNRELIGPYQGIKSAYQGSFLPDQGRALG